MNRWLSWLLGPELVWVLVYGVCAWFAARNHPPTEAGSQFIEKLAWIIPLIAIPVSFSVYAVPGPPRWLGGRLFLATVIGLNVCLFKLIEGIDYQDSRNSGVLGVWVIGLLAGMVAYGASAITRWVVR